MAICKECGTKNPDDFKFCSNCGSSLATIDAAAVQTAVNQVESQFEKDAKVTLDKSRLTYICDICGKVNPIDTPDKRCSRCGKKMPRSDYMKALKTIREARNVQDDVIAERDAAPQPKPVVPQPQPQVEQAVAPQPVAPQPQPQVEQQTQPQVYRMSGSGVRPAVQAPSQNGQIIQPFVIVPYVSQNQPLLQYNPNSVYRYHEYTDDEKRRNQETLLRMQRDREEAERQRAREAERQARIEREAQARIDADNARRNKKFRRHSYLNDGYGKSNGRVTAVFSILFAVAAIVLLFVLESVIDGTMLIADKTITFALNSGFSIATVIGWLFDTPDMLSTLNLGGYLALAGQVVFGISMLAVAIAALIRLFKGELGRKYFAFPILALVGTLAAYVGCCFDANGAFAIGGLTEIFPDYAYCLVVMVAIPLLTCVLEAATTTRPKY